MKKIVIVLLVFLFASCVKEADIKLKDLKPVPVLSCYLSPQDTLISLKLTISQPLYQTVPQNQYAPVNDANVVISSDQGSTSLIYNSSTEAYELKTSVYPIYNGRKYKVAVVLSEGTTAEAETTIPLNPVFVTAISKVQITKDQQDFWRYKVGFTDDPSSANYYELRGRDLFSFFPGDTSSYYDIQPVLGNDVNTKGSYTEIKSDQAYYKDPEYIGCDFYLLNCNYEYYQFFNSVKNLQYDGNPFAESSLVYSNVKGGLGILAGFTYTKYRYLQ